MRALITGGAGFIGSSLARLLVNDDWDVTIVDNLSTGRMSNIQRDMKVSFLHRSIMNASTEIALRRTGKAATSVLEFLVLGCDAIFHLAARVGVRNVIQNPLETMRENIDGTTAILDLATLHQKPCIITSSSEVYGQDFTDMKLHERRPLRLPGPTEQRYGYAAAKVVEEYIALANYQEHGTPVVVARLFNTIGPLQVSQYGMVVPTFIEAALRNEPIVVHGDGSQRRSFTWIGDVVCALKDLVLRSPAYGQVVNVGSEQDISIMELADLVRDVTGSKSVIHCVPHSVAYGSDFQDIVSRRPDLTKIKSLIEYAPTATIRQMLEWIVESKR